MSQRHIPPIAAAESPNARMLRRLESPAWAFSASILLVSLVAWIDHVTGPLLPLSALYLIPIGVAAWTGGKWAGLATAAGASLAALIANKGAKLLLGTTIPYWNAFVRFGIFAAATIAIVGLRNALLLERQRARTDSLTKIPNSRAFIEAAQGEINRCSRFGHPFSIVYMDVDDFKSINDRLGHSVGDQVLKELAALIQSNTRVSDTFARLGGDEFALLLPETSQLQAADTVRKLRDLLDSFSVAGHSVAVSMGTTTFPKAPGSVDEIIRTADSLMYSTKRRRRAPAAQEMM